MGSLAQAAGAEPMGLAWACVAAFLASVLGGLSGFGTGLVLPVFLVPVVGVAQVIPVMAVAMLLNNGSRVVAYRRDIAWPHVRRMLLAGMPACLLGAWGYTLLQARWVALLMGLFLLASVPLRRWLRRASWQLEGVGEVTAGGVFGFVNGGMTGAGILLISFLMSAGLAGPALIATDAVVSLLMGLLKVAVFGGLSALTPGLAAVGLLVGLCTAPGAFVARRLLARMPGGVHAGLMESVVIIGAASLLWRGATT